MLKALCITVIFAILISPSKAMALTFSEAKHFLGRTGFQPSFSEINSYLPLTKEQAIVKRLATIQNKPNTALENNFYPPYSITIDRKQSTRKELMAFNKLQRQRMNQLQQWWLNEMLITHSPMTENLTLFWHNHFVTSANKVRRPELMAMQNLTLRKNAAGNYKNFLKDILQDPAMLFYLDNQRNLKNKPNENLARELLELFTLGEGNYAESDIKTVAKILSGYGLFPKTGEFRFNQKQHDHEPVTLWGKKGTFYLDDLIELILQKTETAELITQKLWTRFISLPIPHATLKKLSSNFRDDYELKPLIREILSQPEFWSADNIGSQIKSPVQLIIGLYRQFEVTPENLKQVVQTSKLMNQNILYPPNVKGWKTGENWINTNTLVQRQNFLMQQTRGMKLLNKIKQMPNENWISLLVEIEDKELSRLNKTFKKAIKQDFDDVRNSLNEVLLMPQYQLQ